MTDRTWSRDENSGRDWDESESLYAATAPFCESASYMARVDGVSLAILTASANSRELVFATDSLAERIDELQFTLGEGPCLASFASGRPQCIADLSHDDRWTVFSGEAAVLGVGAVFSFPVSIESHPVGVLELYRRSTGELTVDEYDAALGCAAAIGAVMASTYRRWSHGVEGDDVIDSTALRALTQSDPLTRAQVHVAASIIATHLKVSITEALVRIRAYAFAGELRVTAVAYDVVDERIPLSAWGTPPDENR
jgi:hypothetical protein